MSYIVIRIYSFECDEPSCEEITDCGGPYLSDAVRELRWSPMGWFVRGSGSKLETFCPDHRPRPSKRQR